MSKLKVTTISDPDNDNAALTIDSSGNVTAPQGFVPSTQLSHRNLIINGAMQVAQRATSRSSIGATFAYYTADRWLIGSAGGTTARYDMSQSTDAPDGFGHSLKLECVNADATVDANEYQRIEQRLEGQDFQQLAFGTSSAKSFTLSFWVKSSVTGQYTVTFDFNDGTTYRQRVAQYTIDSANTWEYKTITIEGDTDTSIANDNAYRFGLFWGLRAGSTYNTTDDGDVWFDETSAKRMYGQNAVIGANVGETWQITGIQLEVGSVATPFEHRSYAEELARCQRYYATSYGGYQLAVDIQDASFASTNFPVTMRADPTATVYAASNGTINKMSRYAGITCTVSSVATYPNGIRLIQHDSESNGQSWGYRWTADAEL